MDSPSTPSPTMSEQADLIAQLVKYSDRLIVVQSQTTEDRSDFIREVAERLPDDVHVFTHEATAESQLQDLVDELAERLQLSPGIEAPRQLVTAIHEAFTGNTRALAVIEDIENWYESDNWAALVELIRVTHEMNSRHLLFILTGQSDLEERLLATPDLADMQGDIHTVTLSSAATDDDNADDIEIPAAATTIPPRRRAQRRFNPTLLIVAAISVLIVTVGGFALLSRSNKEPKPVTEKLAMPSKPATVTAPSTPEPAQPAPAQSPAPSAETNPPKLAQLPTQITPTQPETGTTGNTASETNASGTGEATATQPAAPAPTETPVTTQSPTPSAEPKPEPKTKPQATTSAEKPAAKATPASEPKATPKKVEPKTASKTSSGVDNHWYQQKPRARGVVQLGAFNDLATARGFIKHHQSKTTEHSWHIFTQKPKGQLLYTVTIGDYSSVQRARHAIKSLPASLQKLKPYPRSIGSVQDAIKH